MSSSDEADGGPSQAAATESSGGATIDTSITFAQLGVCDALVEACDAVGFKHPTEIQRDTLPVAFEGRDVIGLAQTGSGKTAAFALPVLQALLEEPRGLFACVVAPTRELAFQIAETFDALGAGIGLKCAVLVGGLDMMEQAIALSKRPHVIIGTPGRIVHHLENTKGFSLSSLRFFILDEADRLLNMDFEEEINTILKQLPAQRRTFLFSATMTSKVRKLQRASLTDPVKVEVCSKYTTVQSLVQNYLFIPAKYKDCYLVYLLNEFAGNSIMIFTATCKTAMLASMMLRSLGFPAVPLSGQMSQSKRLGALNLFKSKSRSILVATDVASRGLDIPHVDLVINYDIPSHSKDYIHRVGRTARAGRAGRSISMVTQYDVELLQRIEHLTGKKMDLFETDQEEVLVFLERVGEAQRLATLEFKETGGKSKRKRGDEDDDDVFAGAAPKRPKKHPGGGKKKKKKSKHAQA